MSSVMRFDTWQDSEGNSQSPVIGYDSVTKTNQFSASVSAGSNVAVTDLSLSYAAKTTNNKLVIQAFFGVAGSNDGRGNVGIAIYDGTSFLSLGDADGSKTQVTAGGRVTVTGDSRIVTMPHIIIEHTPGTTASKTYTVYAINVDGNTQTLYVNRSEDSSSDANVPVGASGLHIMEVAV